MSAHTPGPWHVDLGGFVYSPRTKVADAGFARTEPERTANAYLIAAAPELLDACLLARHICEDGNALQQQIDAALAKATQP